MKKLVSLFAGCMLALLAQAQLVQVVNEAFYVGDGTIAAYPAGATTYRIYAELTDGADAVTAVYAESGSSLLLGTENDLMWSTSFGATTGDAINPGFFGFVPESEYDSVVTIGRANSGDPGGSVTAVSVLPSNTAIDDAFGAASPSQFNADLVMTDGTWFSTPDQVNTNGVGPNFRVLLAQITTTEDIEYNLNLQLLDDGIGGTALKYVWDPASIDTPEEVDGSGLGMSYAPSADVNGCMDDTACNYNAAATIDDGSCVFATGCDTCSGETDGTGTVVDNPEPGESCDDGDANTINDIQNDGCECVGTPIVNGCTDASACNYNVNANNDDGSCVFATGCDTCSGETDGTGTVVDNPEPGESCDDGDANTINDIQNDDCECVGEVLGCTDSTASNYDSSAVTDDGSCLYAVTFNVDMNCEDPASFTTPSVESPAFGWCGGCAPMTDTDLNGVWSITVDLPLGSFEYKYAVDNFAGQEDLIDDAIAGGTCVGNTDFATFANRVITVAAGAVFDDTYGSCDACVPGLGCTDPLANNYDAAATTDDGSCLYSVTLTVDMNCFDGNDPNIEVGGDGTFTTPAVEGPDFGWCGSCVPMTDNGDGTWSVTIERSAGDFEYKYAHDGFAGQEQLIDDMVAGASCAPVTDFATFANRLISVPAVLSTNDVYGSCGACAPGCTDNTACNYDAAATFDDGSCDFSCYGCTDASACNYDATATIDDGSCDLPDGCTDVSACNYDATASCDDGSCEYTSCEGCTDNTACNYNPAATQDDGSCEFTSCAGCTDATACNYDPTATIDDGSCDLPDGCTDAAACNYDAAASCDDGSCEFTSCLGCTDPAASNYDSSATTDDGSCLYAVTFNVDMNCEDPASFTTPAVESPAFGWCGGCVPMTDADMDGVWSVTVDLPLGDFEYKYAVDNFAGQEDLLDDALAGATCVGNTDFATFANRVITVAAGAAFSDTYGSCDACVPGSGGCTDPLANNYDAAATTDDGSCIYDVTLTVDMNCFDGNDPNIESGGDGTFTTPAVEGPSFGWCGSCVPMADNGDGTWSVTLQLPAGDFEYKYAHDGFAGQEQLIDDMVGGASCAPVTDFANFANRLITIPTVLSTNDVYGSCGSCAPGCTDMSACNYDAAATFDDGSCVFATGCDTCSGETDGTGTVVDNPEVGEACDDGNPSTIDDTIQADCSCAGTDPSLPQSQLDYPAGNYSLCQLIKADWVGADDYRFVFDANDGGAATTYEQGAANTFLQLTNVTGLEVGTTYGVTVDALFGTSWSVGTISKDVTITSPSPYVNPNDVCGVHGPHALGDYISAKPYVCGGDKWEWTFTADGQLPIVKTRNSSNRFLRLSSVGGLLPGTAYDVTVRAGYPNGAFTPMSDAVCISIVGVAPGGIAAGGPTVDADADLERTAEGTAAVAFYPNPNTGDFLNVNLMGVESPKVTLDIVNMMGASVKRIELNVAGGNVNEVISLDGLASGVYLVNTTMNGEVFTERLIIQK